LEEKRREQTFSFEGRLRKSLPSTACRAGNILIPPSGTKGKNAGRPTATCNGLFGSTAVDATVTVK